MNLAKKKQQKKCKDPDHGKYPLCPCRFGKDGWRMSVIRFANNDFVRRTK